MRTFQYHMISDRRLLKCRIAEVALAADHAGIEYFQLREKDLSPRALLRLAQEIRPLLQRTLLIVNGFLEVAIASKANGVHLQRGNIPVAAVRARFGSLIIGYSAHSLEEMKEAERQGADYLFISPIFPPLSKGADVEPLGPEILVDWSKAVGIPVFALGGVSAGNLPLLKETGCRGVAGISLFLKNGHFTPEGMVM